MDRFLKLPDGELARVADLARKDALKRELGDTPEPLFPRLRDLILRKCRPEKAKQILAIFERQPFGELERLVAKQLLEVAGLATDIFHLSARHLAALDALIDSWDIDLAAFSLEIVLRRRVGAGRVIRFEFVERAAGAEPGLKQFLADPARLQRVGILSGFAAGAWLGAAEAPTKLVTLGIPPVVISFMMVIGVFLARWSLPALVRGTAAVRDDVRQAPHLVIWAALAGCLWAVANTLTIFAIKDIGLAIAFPLWNANSLLGIVWGSLLFNELRDAGRGRWLGVVGGAGLMFGGATLLAIASSAQAPGGSALRGVAAALAAGALWGTMYIPYRKAYLTGMHPLSFVAFFTVVG